MAAPWSKTWRVSCRGTLAGGEVWANVWHIRSTAPGEPLVNDETAQEVADPFITYYGNVIVNGFRSPNFNLTAVVVSGVNELPAPNVETDVSAYVPPSAAGEALPYQLSCVVSLRTAVLTRRGRGRIYLTGFDTGAVDALAADESPIVIPSLRTALLDATEFLHDSLATVSTFPWGLAVLSEADSVSRFVNRARVGNRWDIQRRRDNALDEAYSNRTLVVPV